MDNQRSELNLYNPLFPLDYFPCRVNRGVVTARMMAQGGCAGGAFDPETNVAWIPIGNAARDRAIRRHEACHANLPPVTEIKMTALFQAIEDMRIHVLGQSTHNNQSRRDELVFALVDMRDSVRLILPKLHMFSPTQQRTNLIPVVRAAAILHYGVTNRRGCESKSPEARVAKMVAKVLAAYEKCYKLTGLQAAIDKAVAALEHDDVVKATNIMRPFLTLANKDANLPQQKAGDSKSKPPKQDKKQDKKDQSPSGQLSADDDEEKEEQEKKSKPAKENKEEKSDKKEKSEESDDEAEEESKDDPSEDGDSESGDESGESEDESESGDAGDESDDESDEDGDDDSEAGDSEADGGVDGEDGEADQSGDDVPMSAEEAAPTGEKGGIGGCGDQLQDAIEDNRITAESVALLDPETIKEILALGRTGVPNMRVRQLEYRMSKRITQGLDYRLSHSGSRINVGRIPRIFDPKPGKIFERIGEQKGGTVLIDASGSMNLGNERLAKLAETIPVGQIAYYSGSRRTASGYDGTLVIYSKGGRSYKLTTGERLPEVYGNNVIDFQAMQWLLKQPAPRWFVSDCQFCSSATTDAAEQLAARAYERKLVTFHCTLGELEIEMHQRIELDDHDKQMVARSGGKRLLSKLNPCPVCKGRGTLRHPDGTAWPDGSWIKTCETCVGYGTRIR